MPPSKILKFLLDIESVIEELERILEFCDHSFDQFNNNFMAAKSRRKRLNDNRGSCSENEKNR